MNRLALLEIDVSEITDLLDSSSPREDGCFLFLRQGLGAEGRRFIGVDPMFPPESAWDKQGVGQLRPSAQWISAVISRAIETHAGLLFVHSHPDSDFPPGFSEQDRSAVQSLGETIGPILEGPFGAAVVHPSGWTAAVYENGDLVPIERTVSVGRVLRLLSPSRLERQNLAVDIPGVDDRQRDALGFVHELVKDSDIAVVGLGGLGSPIGEQLVRMGARVTIIDHDVLDTPSNVRRMFGSVAADLGATSAPSKVDVVGRHLDQLGLSMPVRRVCGDVRDEAIFRALLDADIVISATDTHGSRAVLNDLPSSYLLPVIDVGVQAGAKRHGGLAALVAEIRVLTPVTPCLWCRKSISADVVRAENLSSEERTRLTEEGYLVGGIGEPAPSVVALTVLGAGLAACALLAMLSPEGEFCASGYILDGLFGDAFETQPMEPTPTCRCRQRIGAGDTQPPPFMS